MTAPVRVRQVPAAHAYVENILPVDDPGSVVHLPDPPVPGAAPGQWWPHPALDAGWVPTHGAEQEVIHLHFGTEGRSTEELAAWLQELRSTGLPLVYTVHDIDHPHLVDQTRHREHLALLVGQADGLLTLTEGAAAVVERDFGRRPLVVPHPHVVPLRRIGQGARTPGPLRVGVHLKSLRTNLAPMPLLPSLIEAVGAVRAAGTPVELEVRAHPEVLDPLAARHDKRVAGWWRDLAGNSPPGVELVLPPRLSDEELWDYLAGLDVSVLPYAWGTHSGWVEACRDLGTWVLTRDIGHLAEQGAGSVLTWDDLDMSLTPAVLAGHLTSLLARAAHGPPEPLTRTWRAAQRQGIAATHSWVYDAVLAGQRVDAAAELV